MIVKDGQGRGQVRTVKSVKNVLVKENGKQKHYSVVFVDKPFTVAPNRRSKIDIHEPRKDMIFVKNRFREGAGSGSYGTMINCVWDSNEFSRHEGQLFDVNEGSLNYVFGITVNEKGISVNPCLPPSSEKCSITKTIRGKEITFRFDNSEKLTVTANGKIVSDNFIKWSEFLI